MYHVKVKLKLFFCSVPLNPQLEDLLLRMLIKDPIERITIKGIKVGMVVKKKEITRWQRSIPLFMMGPKLSA